jgi:D-arabinitol dehydrogenase (NADP+)
VNGGFAEYCAYPQGKVFPVHNLNDVDATLLEPASCAAHGLEKIAPKLGSSVLMIGAGPTGLVLAQLLKLNGGCRITLAANAGIKMELAQKLDAADEYIFLDRKTPEKQWEQIKTDNPYVPSNPRNAPNVD